LFEAEEEVADAGEGGDLVEVVLMEEEAAVGLEGLLDHGAFPPGDEDGYELVAAFADLFAEGFDVEWDVDDGEGVSPCGGVEPVAFDEGSVDVGEDGFYHGDLPFGEFKIVG
jgi:hypothetical protein